ncbi:MAG TPA: hypothetical protein PK819_09155, partial [Thermomicrobiales bacterium]|nr:hypothetical protein [Thermomicrobiales bacterium]
MRPFPSDRLGPPSRNLFKPMLFSILTLLIACMVCVVLLSILASTGLNLRAITLAVGAAILPTLVYGAVLVRIDRTEPESWDLRGLAFLWGAVVAVFIALILNTTALTIFHIKFDDDLGELLTAIVA